MRRIISFLTLFALAVTVQAQDAQSDDQSRVGTTAATFLTLGAGAPGASLGHAYTATATGADALFWNPGGAAIAHRSGQKGGLMFSNNEWIAGITFNPAGLTLPAGGSGVVGLSIASVDYGSMKVRTIARPEGTGGDVQCLGLECRPYLRDASDAEFLLRRYLQTGTPVHS